MGLRIEREDFKKLKQLDRIEYRQRFTLISNYLQCNLFITGILLLLFLTTVFVLLFPQAYMVFGVVAIAQLMNVFGIIFGVGLAFTLLGLVLDILFWIARVLKLKELEKEYFGVSVKK